MMAPAYPSGHGPDVRLVRQRPPGYSAPRRSPGAPRPARPGSGRRITAWLVRSIMLATAAFALLDLFLLTSAVHH